MATRNIVNYQGSVIGQLTLPDSTSDSQWNTILAAYALPPTSLQDLIAKKISQYEQTAGELLNKIKAQNTLAGITPAQSAQMFSDYSTLLLALREGAFPTAIYMLQNATPSGFVTQDMLNSWIQLIMSYL